ncbi:type II CAAX endopeptidase family protein [Haloferula sp. BvORR071]|uniref:CPBP family intramembrane glutamic endopeptidase n=1 Tax=Haloferula sp. BvORR071 TaxID=1396141 RepID=UPI000697ADC3|nr:type II CAAX endopeptidase family protein [Haloferula sp. BvORR071]
MPRIEAQEAKKAANPYRQILRRRVPEPVLALLMFLMGVWLWDNHFAQRPADEPRYGEESCRMALIKIDRDLRIAESTTDFPPLVRAALGIHDLKATLDTSVHSLATLGTENALDVEGGYALAILNAIRQDQDPVMGPFVDPRLPGPPDPRIIIARVADGRDSWWDRRYLVAFGNRGATEIGLKPETAEEDSRNRELVLRATVARGMVWVFAGVGLLFLPRTLAAFGRAMRSRTGGYVGRWPMGVGLAIFFLAYLASIGFQMVLNGVISGQITGQVIYLEPPVLAVLDAATRLLPALVALGFLFRKGGHATGRLGLFAKPDLFLILGTFALLTGVDYALKYLLANKIQLDPTGGLSGEEAGWWGLGLALISACLAAPVAEEILYRGVLFRSLANKLRVPAATLFSALVFALVHFYDEYGLLSVGFVGIACALCFAATGNLATAIMLHVLYNFAIKVPEWIVYHAPL